MFLKNLTYIFILFIFCLSCSKKNIEKSQIKETNLELEMIEAYKEGVKELKRGDVLLAAKKFNEAEILYPQSSVAPRAALMAAYSYYSQSYYGDSIAELDRFLRVYPNHKDIAYAEYILALCYYEQIVDEKKDLEAIENSKKIFLNIIKKYPNSDFAIDSEFKLDLINDILAAKEMYVARYYLERKKWIAAINDLPRKILELKGNTFIVDDKSCSIFYENLIKSKFKIINREDPTYLLKAVKNKTEINNMINAHICDGVALTKFLYWIKKINKKNITEVEAAKKLENFRKLNKNFLYPSFDTIAGSGKNGAIVHYRAKRENCRDINKDDIFLCDSGGQYKYGTTDVTRTICFSKQKQNIKNIFTKVLKGHIAVATTDINKDNIGKKIDKKARKFLNKSNLDYAHGTGHGVGFFLNVHEGPQSITKINTVKLKEGMILSNEPGYYKTNEYGIRIENLVYIKKLKKKLIFENLTMAPIEKDLINFNLLTKTEKNYLFKYHFEVYSKISKYLNLNEKKWLASFI